MIFHFFIQVSAFGARLLFIVRRAIILVAAPRDQLMKLYFSWETILRLPPVRLLELMILLLVMLLSTTRQMICWASLCWNGLPLAGKLQARWNQRSIMQESKTSWSNVMRFGIVPYLIGSQATSKWSSTPFTDFPRLLQGDLQYLVGKGSHHDHKERGATSTRRLCRFALIPCSLVALSTMEFPHHWWHCQQWNSLLL